MKPSTEVLKARFILMAFNFLGIVTSKFKYFYDLEHLLADRPSTTPPFPNSSNDPIDAEALLFGNNDEEPCETEKMGEEEATEEGESWW